MNLSCLRYLFLSTSLLTVTSVFGQTVTPSATQPSPEERVIIQLERDLVNAYNTGDAKIIERIVADDAIRGLNKQALLSYKKPYDADAFEINGLRASVWNNTAVATGTMTVSVKQTAGVFNRYFRLTDTFIKRQNAWQLVASSQVAVPVWQTRQMEDNELVPLSALDCGQESSLRSLNSETAAFIKFTNATNQPITRYWIDREGERSSFAMQRTTMPPGKSVYTQTYLTHMFVITDASGKCLGIYTARKEPGLVVIR